MHEVDLTIFDQAPEAPHVGKNGEGIFARHGKRDDLAAGLHDGSRHAATFAGDESRGTGAGERIGDLHRRLLAAASIEARHDLQYGHLSHE
jgi:hypothetical protein